MGVLLFEGCVCVLGGGGAVQLPCGHTAAAIFLRSTALPQPSTFEAQQLQAQRYRCLCKHAQAALCAPLSLLPSTTPHAPPPVWVQVPVTGPQAGQEGVQLLEARAPLCVRRAHERVGACGRTTSSSGM